jgi:Cdc6-like AAA superfamily ATPase
MWSGTVCEFKKFVCWKEENVPAVIDNLALNLENAFLMANHTPFENLRVKRDASGSLNEEVCDEVALLEAIERHGIKQNVFATIQGPPGAGKSHLIWWLSTRLSRKARNEVILVRRSEASLARTLEALVRELGDDYKELVEDFRNASSSLTPVGLSIKLIQNLSLVLNPQALEEKLVSYSPQLQQIRPWVFFAEPEIQKILTAKQGAMHRIAGSLIAERSSDLERKSHLFSKEDFLNIPFLELQNKIGKSQYLIAYRLRKEPALLNEFIKVTNEALSFAIQLTVDLTPEAIYRSFDGIRQRLKENNKTLVLLLEDVAVFQGIDRELINYLSDPGQSPDKSNLIAVVGITDEYFSNLLDNVRQRITEHISLYEDSLFPDLNALPNFISRYLNSVRVGPDELKDWYNSKKDVVTSEVPNHCEDCPHQNDCHSIFGASCGFGLYPFTKSALLNLHKQLKDSNPRFILTDLLRPILLKSTRAINQGTFPPKKLGTKLDAPIHSSSEQEHTLLQKIIPETHSEYSDRYQTIFRYYGSKEVDDNSLYGIPKKLFLVFELPLNDFDPTVISLKPEIVPPPISTPKPKPQPTDTKNPAREERLSNLRKWREDHELLNYTEDYRKKIYKILFNTIDWNLHGFSEFEVERLIKEANLAFEGQSIKTQPLVIEFHRNRETQNALEALVRFQFDGKNSWRYAESCSDQMHLILFVLNNEKRLVQFLSDAYESRDLRYQIIKTAATALVWAGIILGLHKGEDKPAMALISLLKNSVPTSTPHPIDKIQTLRESIRTNFSSVRKTLIDILTQRKGSSAKTPYLLGKVLYDAIQNRPGLDCEFSVEKIQQLQCVEIWGQFLSLYKDISRLTDSVDDVIEPLELDFKYIQETIGNDGPDDYQKCAIEAYKLACKIPLTGREISNFRDVNIHLLNQDEFGRLTHQMGQMKQAKRLLARIEWMIYYYPEEVDKIRTVLRQLDELFKALQHAVNIRNNSGLKNCLEIERQLDKAKHRITSILRI